VYQVIPLKQKNDQSISNYFFANANQLLKNIEPEIDQLYKYESDSVHFNKNVHDCITFVSDS